MVIRRCGSFIVGPRGTYLEEVIRDFGVLVEIPPTEEESDVITLRGPQDKLVNALTRVFERANSMTADELEVPGWLHRLLIGKKGSTLTELTKPFPNCSVDFNEDENLVKIEGPPMEVAGLKQLLTAKRDEMVATLATAELRVDPALHSRIIGKQVRLPCDASPLHAIERPLRVHETLDLGHSTRPVAVCF